MADGAAVVTRRKWDVPPPLRAAGVAAFRALWFAMLALAVIAPVLGFWVANDYVERVPMPFERLGLAHSLRGGRIVLTTPYTEEGIRSGIKAGDRLIAVDGRPVTDLARDRPAIAVLLERPEGATARIRTRSPDGVERDHVLTRLQATVDADFAEAGVTMRQYRAIQLSIDAVPTTFLIVAAILLFRRRSRELAPALLSFGFLLIAAATGSSAYYFYQWFQELAGIDLYRSIDFVSLAGWDIALIVLLLFPDGRFAQRWAPVVALLLIPEAVGELLYLFPVWLPTFLIFFAPALLSLALRYRQLPIGALRQQMRWAFLGFVAGGMFMAMATLVAWLSLAGFEPARIVLPLIAQALYALGQTCFPAGLLVSLLKFRLYDADRLITRSASLAVVTLLLGAAFAALAKGMELFFETYFGREAGAWPGVIGAGLAVALVTPLHGTIHRWAEGRFQKALLRMRRELPPCVGDLRETAGLATVLDETLARIEAGISASRAAVAIDGRIAAARGGGAAAVPALPADGHEPIVEPSDPIFPLRIPLAVKSEPPVGWLLLGPRPDDSLYGKEELEALVEIADPVARAIRVIRLREGREAEHRRREARQDRRIAALEKALRPFVDRPA